jgi:SAM-dependent methyltransferase/uncharacterized protein YbaR (Trm112 family)
MWKRFHRMLRCSLCGNELELSVFKSAACQIQSNFLAVARDQGLSNSDFNQYVEEGVLVCKDCKLCFPISKGLPVLLVYKTAIHDRFASQFSEQLLASPLRSYDFPSGVPVEGERYVLESFSQEWGAYEYDGVLWEANYEDLERRFLCEMNLPSENLEHLKFLEVGCGLGITTHLAQKNYNADAVGLDLSHSVFQASDNYKGNPFLHFVQASVFRLPFEKGTFDAVYSRGVLHHTYSTFDAVKSLSASCRPGGYFYVWVYGKGSTNQNQFRRLTYVLESICRPILHRKPDSALAKGLLLFLALGYLGFNKIRRLQDSRVQKYNLSRAIHAARDRFTPKYAHRHDSVEVSEWFARLGFGEIDVVDWKIMPSVEQDDYRRNIGVRGKRLIGTDRV